MVTTATGPHHICPGQLPTGSDRNLFTIEEAAARVSQPDIAERLGARLLGDLLRRWDGSR